MKRLALLLLLAACDKKPAPPKAVADAAPAELTAAERHALADQVIARECQICHTPDLIRSQRLTRAQWDRELVKMTGWGAVVTDAEAPIVAEDLAAPDAGEYEFARISAADVERLVAPDPDERGDAARGEQKYKAMCVACHGAEGKGVIALGPNLLGKPVLRQRAEFAKVTQAGRNKMPGFANAIDAQGLDDLAAYLRARGP